MSNPDRTTVRLIAAALTSSWRSDRTPLDLTVSELSSITPMLVQSGAAGLVWWRAQLSDLRDSKPAQFLRRAFRSQVLQAVLREQELAHLFASLRCAGVEPILVKGWAIARLYPEKGLRPQGDIDLIVGPHQLSDAYAVLRTPDCEGYQVDLDHREFHRLDARALDGLYARSRLIDDGNVPVRILGAEDHLSFLCRHSLRHSACRPLWLCDIAAELEARPPDFDWDLILRNRQQRDYVETAVSLAHSLIGARLDDTPFASKSGKLPRWLIPAVLRQWENSDPMAHAPFNHLKPMGSYVRNPSGFLKGLIARWPDPIQATVTIGAPFNQVPRLPFQVGECMLRAMKALPIASEAARPAED